jgi:hypothetical protein
MIFSKLYLPGEPYDAKTHNCGTGIIIRNLKKPKGSNK